MKPDSLGCVAADCYRSVSEACVVDMLLLGGWAFEVAAGERDHAAAQVKAAIERWIGLGLGYRRGDRGERLFDPVEVVNVMIWLGSSALDSFWIDRYVQTGRRLVAAAAPGGDLTRTIRLRLQRRFDLQHFEPGARVRLRLPLPLEDASVTAACITPFVPAANASDIHISDGRMDVRLQVPLDGVAHISADIAFVARRNTAHGNRLAPELAALYLRPTEGLIRVSPRIRALAGELAPATEAPLAAVRSFWTFMMERLRSGMVHYDQVPAATGCEWVLDHGWHDCQLGSALLVSLCRSHGIPARIVGGYVLYRLAPTNHFWAEAWIDGRGWMPFDLLSWTLSAGGRDPAWRDGFFAELDFRMVTQILPLAFTGPMSVRFPARWHMVQSAFDDGIAINFADLDGTPIYEERVALVEI